MDRPARLGRRWGREWDRRRPVGRDRHAGKNASEHGWGEYRTHTAFMQTVSDVYSFNNHALRRFNETIKDAIDPNGIFSPGRCGIWPKHRRQAKS